MADEPTSSGPGVTPAPGSPVTGTPAPAGVTPQKPSATTLEEAQARIAELERSVSNKTEENDRHSKKLKAYEEAERKAQEATLSEVEKATKRATAAEEQLQHYKQQFITSQVQLAAQKKGIIDPELAALAIQNSLEFGDDGLPGNVEKALDDLIKSKPYLVASKAADGSPAHATTPAAPTIPAMNPGRTSIAPPSASPGKIPRLTDDGMFKR